MSYDVEADWTTEAGLRAVVIVLRHSGRLWHRCGYVGLPCGHALHGANYGDQLPTITQEMVNQQPFGLKSPLLALTAGVGSDDEFNVPRRSPDLLFDVHGGITYSGGKDTYPVESDLWWFGFDCGHAGDAEIEPDSTYGMRDGIARDVDYVKQECERLAAQISQHFPPSPAQS